MKHLILGLAIAGLSFACASEPKTSVGEADATPAAECTMGGDCCDEGMKSECTGEAKSECSTGEVCPVTGKPAS